MKYLVSVSLLVALLALVGSARGDGREDVAKWIKTLKTSKSNDERVSAISDLMQLSRENPALLKPVIPDLVEVLKSDKNPQVRSTAGLIMANTGAEAKPALPVAIAILNDQKEKPEVKIGAAKVVGACGIFGIKESKEALPILTTIEKAETAKDAASRNERLLEIVSEAIRSINVGAKDK
jgi:HEAT repeat protein